jgi:endonuclease-3
MPTNHRPNKGKTSFLVARTRRCADILRRSIGNATHPKRKAPPMDMLIATLLSQNTNDINSFRAWQGLKVQFPTWDSVLNAQVDALAASIKVGGMNNQKARRIQAIVRRVKEERGNYSLSFLKKMDTDQALEDLASLDGVGFKTAACVLAFSFHRDVFPVDTHIHRICNRLGLVDTKNPEMTFREMESLIPKGRAYELHTNLIRFGRAVCTAKKPLCYKCPLLKECVFEPKNMDPVGRVSRLRQQSFLLSEHI